MAVSIPIISEFDGKGISKAITEFKNLEGAGAKAQFAIKKAAVPAAAALTALAAAAFSSAKAAMEDEAAQVQLALALKNNTSATDAQIKANEDFIATQGKLFGVTDDDLRPAIARLVTQTHDLDKAQRLVSIAQDVSAGTGKDLSTVTEALAKAAGGSTTALGKLSPELKQLMKDGLSADEAIAKLAETFDGAASTAAETAQGKFKRLGVALNETKESIGAALLPAVEKVLPFLTKFGDFAQNNTDLFLKVAGAIALIAAATVAVNVAMATNPYVLMAAGVLAVAVAFDRLVAALEKINKIAGVAAKIVGLFAGIPQLGFLDNFVKDKLFGGKDSKPNFENANVNPFAAGVAMLTGVNSSASGSLLGPGGVAAGKAKPGKAPEIAPPPMIMNGGGEGMLGFGDIQINVQAGLIGTPISIGQDIIDAIQAAQRASGTVFAPAA